jgi:hypothetical protein
MHTIVSSVSVNPFAVHPIPHRGLSRLTFLQHKDVFFASQSLRAQVTRFLHQPKQVPHMVCYHHESMETLLDHVLPNQTLGFLVLRSAGETGIGKNIPKPRFSSAAEILHNIAPPETDEIKATQEQAGEIRRELPPHPHLASQRGAKQNPFVAPLSQRTKRLGVPVEISTFSGIVLPAMASALQAAFAQAPQRDPYHASWVVRDEAGTLMVLPKAHPAQCGYVRVHQPWMSWGMKALSQLLTLFPGFSTEDNRWLVLPNQRKMALERYTWRNPQGHAVDVFQVIALPVNGQAVQWCRLDAEPQTEVLERPRIWNRVVQLAGRFEHLGLSLAG